MGEYFPNIVEELGIAILDKDEFVDGVSIVVEEGVEGDGELFESVAGGDDDADVAVVGEG